MYGHIASEQAFSFDELEAGIKHFFQYLDAAQLDVNAKPEDNDTMALYVGGLASYIRKGGINVAEPPPAEYMLSDASFAYQFRRGRSVRTGYRGRRPPNSILYFIV